MHLNKLLEQIKRHQSPTEAIDKLATALEKHEGSLLEKGFTMLENERIIVQDRGGIDAGIAALMQNANKGFDPAALMAMMNNGNGMFGGNGGWWWIFIIVLFWMWGGWGGNGFGRGNQAETNSDFARLAAMGNQNNNTDLLMQAINGNKDAINTLSTKMLQVHQLLVHKLVLGTDTLHILTNVTM